MFRINREKDAPRFSSDSSSTRPGRSCTKYSFYSLRAACVCARPSVRRSIETSNSRSIRSVLYTLFYIRGFLRKNRGWEIGSRLRLHFRPLRDEGGGCVITEPRLKKSGGSLINGAFAASIALRIVTASTSRRVIAFSVHRRRIVISASIGLGNGQTRVGVENTSALIIKANGTATMAELLVKKKRSKKKGAKTGL